ncbi:Bacteriophage Mu GpT domain-containing protein [Deinococcus saxicola]|uniref:phage major capsid protein n=1 Tax=Deinococcus saxicola TaxID=249406 RepID=UPI0039EEDB6A
MSIKEIRFELTRLADRGVIPENRVIPLTIQTVLESAQQHFQMGYFGQFLDKELDNVRAMDASAKEAALIRMEGMILDFEKTRRAHRETHTTSDFPLAVAQVRQAASRPGFTFPESDLPKFAARRTATDFKALKGTRPGAIGHRFLPVRPEAANIEYTKFFTSEEGYTVADYALALTFTFEAYINDDLGDFTAAAADLGNVARRTRASVILDVILRKAPRVPLADGEQGPTPANLDQLAAFMSAQVDATTGRRASRRPTDLFVPTIWERKAAASMANEYLVPVGGASGTLALVPNRNPAYMLGNIHVEDMIADLLAEYPDRYAAKGIGDDDYLVVDGRNNPFELAALRGYEGGPKTFTRIVNVDETDLEGDFENRNFALKVHDVVGADLRDPYGVVIAQGD